MKTEDKKMIYEHLALTSGCYLPTQTLNDVCEIIETGLKAKNSLFELLYSLEKDKGLKKYKVPQNGAFYVEGEIVIKQINQLSMDGEFIASFKSIGEAALSLGDIKKKGKISDVLNGKSKSAYKFKWEFEKGNPSLF